MKNQFLKNSISLIMFFHVDVSCNAQLENINLIDKTVVSFNIIQFTKKY